MAQLKKIRRKLKLTAIVGDVGGKVIKRTKSYNDVKSEAGAENLLSAANAIAELMKYPVDLKAVEDLDEITE